jgi:CIC family chloride channel protein
VRRILDRKIVKVSAGAKPAEIYAALAPTRQSVAFVQRDNGEFVGMIDAADLNAALRDSTDDPIEAEKLAQRPPHLLTPADPLTAALRFFEASESLMAPVVARQDAPRLIGCVHEADLLRLYLDEADRMRREELGTVGLLADVAGRVKPR